jgi:hypothetical protein
MVGEISLAIGKLFLNNRLSSLVYRVIVAPLQYCFPSELQWAELPNTKEIFAYVRYQGVEWRHSRVAIPSYCNVVVGVRRRLARPSPSACGGGALR